MNPQQTWRPGATLEALQARARLNAGIRAFFDRAGVLEVETPALSAACNSDPNIQSFICTLEDGSRYLHTSPEFAMKRLLAAGSGPIYQICKVFRAGESGARHNPEFTLLEWYRPDFSLQQLIDEVADLVNALLPLALPVRRYDYSRLFLDRLGVDIDAVDCGQLRQCAQRQGIEGISGLSLPGVDAWLDLLMSYCIEPDLGRNELSFVTGYPASQASLARLSPRPPHRAERFELYLNGMELANGFHELADADEQRRRFEQDLVKRAAQGLSAVPLDENLLSALQAGLPDCSGVALGVDRLLMQILGEVSIDQVVSFSWSRA